MHDIEPWWGWREIYSAEFDRHSPFHKRQYSEFTFTNKIYNYYIHPQWDSFGSETLYAKILYVQYTKRFALIELIGEWNDAIGNDIMYLKNNLLDFLISKNIDKFVVFCDNVLNFHGDDDSYYELWYDDIKDQRGWIALVNVYDHVSDEMNKYRLNYYMNYGPELNNHNWRTQKPDFIAESIHQWVNQKQRFLF